MKKLLFLIFSYLVVSIFTNCSEESEKGDGLPYYKFEQDDLGKLINQPIVGTELKYKNQDNEVIIFKVYFAELGKTIYSTGNFSSSYASKHFYYDKQEIKMWYNEGWGYTTCEIILKKYPLDSNYRVDPPIIGQPGFYGYFEFPLWNGYVGTDQFDNSISIDFNLPMITMTFNGKTYSKVRVYESNKTQVLGLDYPSPPYRPRNVNKLYYDQNSGIIGFDDLNGKKWRLE